VLTPNPLLTPIAKDAVLTDLKAGPRRFRSSRDVGQGKQITQLILKADPLKGPFGCDFKLGEFELKLLSVRVNSKPEDIRISAKMAHPESGRQRDVYFRYFQNEDGVNETRNKFLELRSKKNEENKEGPIDAYFVAIDSANLDVATGLWSKIVFSLINVQIPRFPPAQQAQAQTQ
jgi:hypothetical protein